MTPQMEEPAANRGRRYGFTLAELLVVVSIVALLTVLLTPQLLRAKRLARAAVCASNLRQLSQGFEGARNLPGGMGSAGAARYPAASDWPGIPLNVLPAPEVYRCPEEETLSSSPADYQVRSQEGFLIPLTAGVSGVDHCIQRPPPGGAPTVGWTYYGIEDLALDHSDKDYNDEVIAILDGSPSKLLIYSASTGYANDLCFQGTVVTLDGVLWHDLRQFVGKWLYLSGGMTNYAINSEVARRSASSDVALLDYDALVAYPDRTGSGSMTSHLVKGARHNGQLNVMFDDGSVRRLGVSSLDPFSNLDNASMWLP